MKLRNLWFVAILGLALIAGPAIAEPDKKVSETDADMFSPKDVHVQRAVERELLFDRAIPFDDIRTTVTDGVVTLEGTVENILARERAVNRAQTVRGVTSVVDKLAVVPSMTITDTQVMDHVKQALLTDPATDSYEVKVTVQNGKVTLEGMVDSWHERVLAATVTKGVDGVRDVVNSITVDYKLERPDAEITAEVEAALRWDVYVDDGMIDVKVKDGVVKLSGIAGSAAEKRRAASKAWTSGVMMVDARDLEVSRWARTSDLRSEPVHDLADSKVEDAVTKALVHDPRVFSFNVMPHVDDGLVTLTGAVDNLRAKRAAESSARNTMGVAGVLNHLRVHTPEPRSDKAIHADVVAALKRDPFVSRYQIGVAVTNGKIRLTGTADTHFERRQADDVASRVTGVRDIVNRVRVLDRPMTLDPYVDTWLLPLDASTPLPAWTTPMTDIELEHRIRAELLWSPFVDETKVDVDVVDGVATLTGKVDSWRAWKFARANAYDAGATLVKNHLEVKEAMSAQ